MVEKVGIKDEVLKQKIIELDESCRTCLKYKNKDWRPNVGFSIASDFNECIAMNILQWI